MSKQLFRDFLGKIKPDVDDKLAWETVYSLFLAYDPKKRQYHNISHIYQCVTDLWKVSNPLQEYFQLDLPELNQMEYALWYHDIFYDPGNSNNEVISARIARECGLKLGLYESFIKGVERFILVTDHKREPADIFEKYMVDIDLGILGYERSSYRSYKEGIREEYSMYSWDDYCKGRKAILSNFLAKEKIYLTPMFQDKYEKTARENIQKEIDSLVPKIEEEYKGSSFLPMKPKENDDVG